MESKRRISEKKQLNGNGSCHKLLMDLEEFSNRLEPNPNFEERKDGSGSKLLQRTRQDCITKRYRNRSSRRRAIRNCVLAKQELLDQSEKVFAGKETDRAADKGHLHAITSRVPGGSLYPLSFSFFPSDIVPPPLPSRITKILLSSSTFLLLNPRRPKINYKLPKK